MSPPAPFSAVIVAHARARDEYAPSAPSASCSRDRVALAGLARRPFHPASAPPLLAGTVPRLELPRLHAASSARVRGHRYLPAAPSRHHCLSPPAPLALSHASSMPRPRPLAPARAHGRAWPPLPVPCRGSAPAKPPHAVTGPPPPQPQRSASPAVVPARRLAATALGHCDRPATPTTAPPGRSAAPMPPRLHLLLSRTGSAPCFRGSPPLSCASPCSAADPLCCHRPLASVHPGSPCLPPVGRA
nr:formin-like protein 20 [Aegilops tauschii subsp. strangulata]